ncbi:putative mitochondrial carrier protein [Rosa chinensis]|uniref:ADP/ATP translocase n=1 Tax=Rosa chinensis TaxID=74649 RepID=A0A2P6PU12_ROSCH|nr:putative mitochondrial carrier protein [Rosa chinensis]
MVDAWIKAMNATKKKYYADFREAELIGVISAAIVKIASAPIDRVKILIQNQNEMIMNGRLSEPYKGIKDCFGRIIKDEGVSTLWRGNTANVIRYLPSQVLTIGFNHFYKVLFSCDNHLVGNLVSGAAAGSSSLFSLYSLDYVRTRLASDIKATKGGQRQFQGLIDVYRTAGFQGTYRGFNISFAGAAVYRSLYFGLYDSLRPHLADRTNFFSCFLLGWGVVTSAGFASYPIDTVRRRMMMTSAISENAAFATFRRIIRDEGVKSLYKGAGANVLRGVAGAVMLAVYDKLNVTLCSCNKSIAAA